MILSNTELHAALDDGRLIIKPEPKPRKPQVQGGHCPYDTHSVDLRLSDEIVLPRKAQFSYNLTVVGNLAALIKDNSDKYTATKEQPFVLRPNTFALGRTTEWVALPVSPHANMSLAARIEGKSSRARLGLLVHFTAPTVHPGFERTLTLEMINLGQVAIELYPEMAIAQLIVEEVKGVPDMNNPSSFQGQSTAVGLPDE